MPEPLISVNQLKKNLKSGGTAVGTMLIEVRQPSIMQILANAGFEFVLIDTEHGPFSIETVADLCRTVRLVDITPIVRVPEITYAHITQALDAGAQGIMIPRVTEATQVHTALEMMKYPPMGKRGSVLMRGHTEFKAGGLAESLAAMNAETMLIVQIETRQAAENLDSLLSIAGVDAALIGPTDLTVAFGKHGNVSDPDIQNIIDRTITACTKHGAIPAIHFNDLPSAQTWATNGMKMISYSSEIGMLNKEGRAAVHALRESFASRQTRRGA
ncbi:MAG TPA: aldolase/citrate lyase family protein [Bacteroidota bacterium]|nr:aldolase/citrate lyase family protein [Bacteroidota bacterium]